MVDYKTISDFLPNRNMMLTPTMRGNNYIKKVYSKLTLEHDNQKFLKLELSASEQQYQETRLSN